MADTLKTQSNVVNESKRFTQYVAALAGMFKKIKVLFQSN